MRVKAFLGRALHIDDMINSEMAELDSLRRLSMNIGGSRLDEKVTHSAPSEAPFAKWVERIVDKEKEVNEKIDRLVAIKMEISDFIDKVQNARWQRLLRTRYVMCKSWPDVAVEMNCGLSTVFWLHKKILQNLENESK